MELRVNAVTSRLAVPRAALLILAGTLVTVVLHLSLSGLYGYQRDELYFVACAQQLAWGYVDQPPLIALIAGLAVHLFGDGVSALRVFPGLAAGGLVALAGFVANRFGGGPFAVATAMVAVALAPFDLAVGNLLTMNAFEPLFWLLLMALALAQIESPRRWRWAAIGLVVGIGFLNKWSMAMYGLSLLVGMLLSPVRRTVLVPGLAATLAIAGAIAAPNIVWQAAHGWPQIQVVHNGALLKNEHVPPALFLLEQFPMMNPLCAPLWLAGLWGLVRSRRYAGFTIAYGVLVAAELALHGKVYYVAPIYPGLIAAGAVVVEQLSAEHRWFRSVLLGAVAVAGILILPMATPALPLPALLDYQRAIDVRTIKIEDHPVGLVPQQFADQLGWDDLEQTIAAAVATLTPAERRAAAILTADYGQAGALALLGRRDRLPPVISGHNQYYLWGPRGDHAVLVTVGIPAAVLARAYRSVERIGEYASPYVLPDNNHLPIYVCRDPRLPLTRFWPELRNYL